MRSLIGSIRALLMALLLVAPVPAIAGSYVDSAALDELFAELKAAPSVSEANAIVSEIWTVWFSPDNPDLKGRMGKATVAMTRGDLAEAIAVYTEVTEAYPDYSEGWNQRATLYYEIGNLEASLADIAKVLALEPRHFGALSGRVMIYLRQGKRELALEDMRAAIAINPYLSSKELFPELAPNVTHV